MDNNTIAAIATPTGFGGIGIIKISGKGALTIAESIFRRSGASSDKSQQTNSACFSDIKSHQLYYGHVVDPANGRVLDEVLMSVMLAPHTYTKENIVEINTHSGPVVLASILDLVIKNGARLAEPGEFTKRAYLNGRIDLTQAEAVIDIINSRTDKALEIATSQIRGELRKIVESIRKSLINLLTDIEAAIDFPDDVGEIINTETAVKVLKNNVIVDIKELIGHYENAHIFRDGLKMVVVGRPNVGKSSLMNRLIQDDRAIVTSIPGTTRDLIEEILNIHGIPVIIADTAGLHETDDPVEVIGIKKAKEYINGSDLVLFMVDASDSLTREDYQIYESINDKKMILVVNKSDLVEDDFEIEIDDSWKQITSINISALYGSGITELKDLIAKLAIGEDAFEVGNKIIPNLRHKIALERCLQLAVSAVEEILKGTPFELIAIDILEAVNTIGEVIGVTVKEDVLDQIFNRFCIGK